MTRDVNIIFSFHILNTKYINIFGGDISYNQEIANLKAYSIVPRYEKLITWALIM